MLSVSGRPDSDSGASSDGVRAGPWPLRVPGAALARLTRSRLLRDAIVANGLGGLLVLILGVLAPGAPNPDDAVRLAVLNVAVFVVFVSIAFPVGSRWGRQMAKPLVEWLEAERPATPAEQDLALSYPAKVTKHSVKIWVVAVIVFTAVNATESAALATTAAIVAGLGGATCCAILYLLVERDTRPLVARALAGRAPAHARGPTVAARLTMTWTLVTGVPLVGIAAIVIADLAGAEIDTLATVSTLFLALVALAVGLSVNVLAARSVGDPVRAVQEAMASVERGEFDARVSVDDGSEVGLLQAGFNRMAAGWPSASACTTSSGGTSARTSPRRRSTASCGWAARSARSASCSSTSWAPPPSRPTGRRRRSWRSSTRSSDSSSRPRSAMAAG